MLVLSRKANESIQIGENVTIEIRRIAGNRVTVAINAPRDVRILRGELEQVAKEFEQEPEVSAKVPQEEYSVTHRRLRMPRIHHPYRESATQAVG